MNMVRFLVFGLVLALASLLAPPILYLTLEWLLS